jgi:hypothetical protein
MPNAAAAEQGSKDAATPYAGQPLYDDGQTGVLVADPPYDSVASARALAGDRRLGNV